MAMGEKISVLRGQEATVQVRLRLRSTVDDSLSEVDLSGSPSLTWRAVSDLGNAPASTWIEKTSGNSEISVITDGTSGSEAVIQLSLTEGDTDTARKGWWVCWMVKGGATTPFRPGKFEIEGYPTL